MNLLIEPLLCFIALPLGLTAVPLITIAPDRAQVLLNLGTIALEAADSLTQWADHFSYASLWTVTPSIQEILFYYLLLIWGIYGTYRWKKILITFISALLIINFATGFFQNLFSSEKYATITFLDVGQGTATLFEFSDGTRMLLDGGGSYSDRYNVGKNIIAPFLWKQRIRQIDTIIITHPDSDHYSGLPFIVQQFSPQMVYTNGQEMQSGSYHALMELITQRNIAKKQATSGEKLHEDSLCALSCLGMQNLPVTMKNPTDNNQSLILRLQCDKNTFMFPGDIEKDAENFLLQQQKMLQADVLLAAHHGSKTSNSHAFLQAVAPQLIIVSAGRTKNNLFPALQHKQWWEQQEIPYLITGINGTVICTTDGTMLTTTCSGQ
jgi:competence protein ComEC